MARSRQTRGPCGYCEKEMTRGGMARHLPTCEKRREAVAAADQGKGKRETLYHLQVQDAWGGDFWLHLEMRGPTPLVDLDSYLRAIWLECCYHLSQFSFHGWRDKVSMNRKADQVFRPGLELQHYYDFGTTSETLIKVVGMRHGKPTTRHPIALMARNAPPQYPCMTCERPATWYCMECVYEDEPGLLCDEHARTHPHEEYGGPVAVVNSPRLGMCGYDGPAEPPY